MRLGDDYEFGLDKDEQFGWLSEEDRVAHVAEGLKLRELVQERLGSSYRVELTPLASGALERASPRLAREARSGRR